MAKKSGVHTLILTLVFLFSFLGILGCNKSLKEDYGQGELSVNTPSEYKNLLEEKIKTYMGDVNLGAKYDFSNIKEKGKAYSYEEYEKYYKNLDSELTTLKNELNSKVSPSESQLKEANRKITMNIEDLKGSISSLTSELKANRNKALGMNDEEFLDFMQGIERPLYESRLKLQEVIDEVKNNFK